MNQTRWPSRILCLCGAAIWTLDHTWYSTHPVDRWCKSFTPHKNGKICDQNHKSILDCIGVEDSFGALSDSASQYGCLGEQSGTLSRKGNTSKPAMDLEDISGIFFTKRKWWWIDILMIFHQYQCMIVDVGINRNRNPGDDIDTFCFQSSPIIYAHRRRKHPMLLIPHDHVFGFRVTSFILQVEIWIWSSAGEKLPISCLSNLYVSLKNTPFSVAIHISMNSLRRSSYFLTFPNFYD